MTLGLAARGGGAVSQPEFFAGATGVWYMDDYQTTNSNPIIPNAASAVPVFPEQLVRQSHRIYQGQGTWNWYTNGSGLSVETAFVGEAHAPFYTDRFGNLEATRITITAASGNGWLYQTMGAIFPGDATYTVACDVRLVSGNGKFKIGNPFGNRSSELTATSSWQRFSFSSSNSQGIWGIGHNAPAGDTVLEINNFNAFAGGSDLGVEPLGGHLRLGTRYGTYWWSYASGVLTATDAAGTIQFATSHQPTNTTVFFHGTVLQPFSDPGIQGMLSQLAGDGYTAGLNVTANGLGLSFGPDGGVASYALLPLGGAHPLTVWDNTNPHVYAVRWNGTNCTWWVDGVQSRSGAPGAMGNIPTIHDLLFNCLTSHPGSFKYKSMAYFLTALSDAEIASASAYLAAR